MLPLKTTFPLRNAVQQELGVMFAKIPETEERLAETFLANLKPAQRVKLVGKDQFEGKQADELTSVEGGFIPLEYNKGHTYQQAYVLGDLFASYGTKAPEVRRRP